MININTVRNTVLRLLNKSNRGYIGVDEFNDFCNLAQLSLFEDLFSEYNNFINKQNKRFTNSEYADIPKNIREQIDIFASYSDLTYNSITNLWEFTDNDFYRTENISLVNINTLKRKDVEEISKSDLNRVSNSNMIAPTLTYPAYLKLGNDYRLFPQLDTNDYKVEIFYIRKPKYPKWTYINVGGNPMYNPSATDLQHIELSESLTDKFIVKVMQYCGVSIREQDVVQMSGSEEVKIEQRRN